jgi:hypothetical protein
MKKPEIICICGSTKFKKLHLDILREKTLEGYIVLLSGVFGHADNIQLSIGQKNILDKLHLRKIDLADKIFVINKNGYIGESTKREIEYAKKHKKKIEYLDE